MYVYIKCMLRKQKKASLSPWQQRLRALTVHMVLHPKQALELAELLPLLSAKLEPVLKITITNEDLKRFICVSAGYLQPIFESLSL